jgi:hypothetical protein
MSTRSIFFKIGQQNVWLRNSVSNIKGLRVFENRVLRRIFGPKRDEVTVDWRKLHNEELHNLYSSRIIIRIMKSMRMRWEGHVARIGERRGTHIGYWWGSQKERDP